MSKQNTTSKVKQSPKSAAPAAEKAPKAPKAPKADKAPFVAASAVDAAGVAIKLDDQGRLTGNPTIAKGDPRPGRKNFASKHLYFEYRASEITGQIQSLETARAEMLERAEEARTGGDPTAQKLRKAKKMRDQLAALERELAAEGIEV